MRSACFCNRYLVEETTAMSAVNGVATCNPGCHNAALDAQKVPERVALVLMDAEPDGVMGGAREDIYRFGVV